MSYRKKVYFVLTFVCLVLTGWYLYNHFDAEAEAAESTGDGGGTLVNVQQDAIPVELAQAQQGPVSSFLTSTANLRALRDVVIASQTEGFVTELVAEEGDLVESGGVLCRLDDRELLVSQGVIERQLEQARLQSKQAEIQKRKIGVQLKNARAELERNETAFREGLVGEEDVASLRYRVEELEHDLRAAGSRLEELLHRVEELKGETDRVRLEVSKTRVVAPFSGYIAQRMAELGQTVRSMDALFRLTSFPSVYADVHLAERAAQQVQSGHAVTARLESGGDMTIKGRVLRVSPVVDEQTGTVKVTAEFRQRGDVFRPGAFVVVQIRTDTRENAVLIPKRAILEEDGQFSVYVVEEEVAQKRQIVLGYEAETRFEILSGVEAQEQVVVAGQGNLQDGVRVKVIGS